MGGTNKPNTAANLSRGELEIELFFRALLHQPDCTLAPLSLRIAAMATIQISLPLPVLPQGWAGEKDFKPVGALSAPVQRNIEPVGPHFLAHARRVSRRQLDVAQWLLSLILIEIFPETS
jgi:hypothetical protein